MCLLLVNQTQAMLETPTTAVKPINHFFVF